MVIVTIIGLVLGIGLNLFGKQLLGLFANDNEAIIAAGLKKLAITGMTQFLCGLMEVGGGVMRGFGKSILPMFVSLLGSCVLRVVWVYTVFTIWRTPECLYLSYPVTWVLTAATHYVCCFITMRKVRKAAAAA